MTQCHRCGTPVDHHSTCFFCDAPLCYRCSAKHGHCGHTGAQDIAKQLQIMPAHTKLRMAYALGWIAEPDAEVWGVN